MEKKRLSKILIIILTALALILFFFLYSSKITKKSDELIISLSKSGSQEKESSSSLSAGRELFNFLKILSSIKLETDFFKDEVFQSLTDFSVKLTPEKTGRQNPFAPLK